MKLKLTILFILICSNIFSQKTDTIKPISTEKSKFFANIYPCFYLQNSKANSKYGFNLSTALFGYEKSFSDKIKGTIIFDVTRTTNAITVFDTNGYQMPITFFEGSKYTAFLKMAEISWQFHKKLKLSVGQLLNTQYLTFQDKFWQHRYVEVTYQELNKFGMPADFGFQLNFSPNNKISIDFGVFNGEGPFRYQDNFNDLLYNINIEFKPIKTLILKVYGAKQTDFKLIDKYIFSFFSGFQNDKFTIGTEYNIVKDKLMLNYFWSGLSIFSFYNFTDKFQTFYRFDYTVHSNSINYVGYHIFGIQYSPLKNFMISINYRLLNKPTTNMIFINFGLKF